MKNFPLSRVLIGALLFIVAVSIIVGCALTGDTKDVAAARSNLAADQARVATQPTTQNVAAVATDQASLADAIAKTKADVAAANARIDVIASTGSGVAGLAGVWGPAIVAALGLGSMLAKDVINHKTAVATGDDHTAQMNNASSASTAKLGIAVNAVADGILAASKASPATAAQVQAGIATAEEILAATGSTPPKA